MKQEPEHITEILTLEQVNQYPMTAKAHIDGLQRAVVARDNLLKDIFKDITKDNKVSPDTFDRLVETLK